MDDTQKISGDDGDNNIPDDDDDGDVVTDEADDPVIIPDEEMTYDIGSGSNDWWINYPTQNSAAGLPVDHLEWVTDQVASRPVLLFVHTTSCVPCVQQTEYMNTALSQMSGYDVYFQDILADGSDPRSSEVFGVYDPTGAPNYIPLTVFVSYAENDAGNKVLVWHSVEGATSVQWITSYLADALMYYE